jgi:signal transduction histidine kinase
MDTSRVETTRPESRMTRQIAPMPPRPSLRRPREAARYDVCMSRRSAMLLIVFLTAIGATLLLAMEVVDTIELPVRDLAVRSLSTRPASSTVVVAIDERSLAADALGPWPWDRRTLAALVDRARESGARAVIFDVLLVDARDGDEQLAASMRRIPTIAVSVLLEEESWLLPSPALRSAAVVAHGNFELDHDGILRRFATTKQDRTQSYPALSIEAASMIRPTSVPVGQTIAPAFRTPPHAVPQVSAIDLIHGTLAANALRGKLVFIGPTALGLGDRVLTPLSRRLAPDAGVTVHAAATESLLRAETIHSLSPLASGLAAASAVALILASRRRRRTHRLLIAGALLLTIAIGGTLLLASTGIAIPFVTLMLSIVITSAAIEGSVMRAALRESGAAASRLETGLGMTAASEPQEDVALRLEEIATRLAEHRVREVESKRVLAHELKTPLASMRGLTQLLSGFDLSEKERRRVAFLLEEEAGKLQSMVTALLDLERLPLRDFTTTTELLDLGRLVTARVAFVRASDPRPIDLDVAPDLTVRADPMLLERVVDNLLGNALKYTPAGSPVTVHAVRRNDLAVLSVEDRGGGIREEERTRLFDRFYRGSAAAGTEGLGLGLALVAEVAKWHHGTVEVLSGTEGGSRFEFVLPLADSNDKGDA